MIKVRQISHATFETPGLEAQIEHYTKVTGLVVAAQRPQGALPVGVRGTRHARELYAAAGPDS